MNTLPQQADFMAEKGKVCNSSLETQLSFMFCSGHSEIMPLPCAYSTVNPMVKSGGASLANPNHSPKECEFLAPLLYFELTKGRGGQLTLPTHACGLNSLGWEQGSAGPCPFGIHALFPLLQEMGFDIDISPRSYLFLPYPANICFTSKQRGVGFLFLRR